MRLLQKILFATDFGPSADDALQTVVAVARKLKSEVFLIHVIRGTNLSETALKVVTAAVNDRLAGVHDECVANGVQVSGSVIAIGSPFDQIVEHANALDVNVIMIGSGEFESDERFHLGITAEKVARGCTKPVWVVRQGSSTAVTKILCPVDFSPPSRRAINNAIHLARCFEAELQILTVVEPLTSGFFRKDKTLAVEHQAYRQHVHDELDAFLKELDFNKVSWHTEVREGKPDREILKATADCDADLLIMGSTGKTGVTRILMGSTTEKVVREMPCSFIVAKAEDIISPEVEALKDDVQSHYHEGIELLENGFPDMAIKEFKKCIGLEETYVPAWSALAMAHERLGDTEAAQQSLNQIKQIHQMQWDIQVVADIRSRHMLFGGKNILKSM